MKRKGLKPDVKTYSTIMNVCVKNCLLREGIALKREMKKHGVRPNLTTYNTLINICSKCGDLKKALEIKSEMENDGLKPDEKTFSTLMSVCVGQAFKQRAYSPKTIKMFGRKR